MRTIQHKRGLKANLPKLAEGELGFTTDKKELYIGSAGGNVKIGGTSVEVTLSSTGWNGTADFTQTVNVTGVTAESNGVVGVSQSANKTAYEQAVSAMLRKTAQGNGTITITAYGDKPTVNIPITVLLT